MRITINGKTLTLSDSATLHEALVAQGLNPSRVVVERNGAVVPASAFAATVLEDGDILEVLHFVGGG